MKKGTMTMAGCLAIWAGCVTAQQMPQDNWYFERTWGSQGSVTGKLSTPIGVAVDGDGRVYVAEGGNHRIQVFERDGAFVRTWGSSGSTTGKFYGPQGVAVGGDGRVYVVDNGNRRIQVFERDGTFVRTWGSYGSATGQFNSPQGIAVGGDGRVYVADSGNNRIQVFENDGTFVRTWGSYGSAPGLFNSLRGIAVDGDGRAYVTDNGRIQVFESDGSFVRSWTVSDPVSSGGVSISPDGLLFNIVGFYGYVRVYSPEGTVIRTWGSAGSGSGQFSNPAGIAVDNAGRVYVTDSSAHRIQVFRRTGRAMAANVVPQPQVLAAEQRAGMPYVDIDYIVHDPDSSNLTVAALAFVGGANSLNGILRLNSLVEDSATNLGANIPANQTNRITWNAAADWSTNFGQASFEILAMDTTNLLDFHFLRIPSNGPDPELVVDRSPVTQTDLLSCWYWLVATNDPAVRLANGAVYQDVALDAAGDAWPNGLLGNYYNNVNLTGTPTQRVDTTVAFPSGVWQPAGISNNYFSARWTGVVVPDYTETYTFFVYAFTGKRLWVNGQLLIDQWTGSGEHYGTIALTAGRPVPIVLEYCKNTTSSGYCSLRWQSPSRAKQDITSANLFAGTGTTGIVNRVLASGTTTFPMGRQYLFGRMGVREATTAEVARVKQGYTPGVINQWLPRITGDRRQRVNELGVDTYEYGSTAWFVVKP